MLLTLHNTEFRQLTSPHSTVRIGLAGEWVTLLVAPGQSLGFEKSTTTCRSGLLIDALFQTLVSLIRESVCMLNSSGNLISQVSNCDCVFLRWMNNECGRSSVNFPLLGLCNVNSEYRLYGHWSCSANWKPILQTLREYFLLNDFPACWVFIF